MRFNTVPPAPSVVTGAEFKNKDFFPPNSLGLPPRCFTGSGGTFLCGGHPATRGRLVGAVMLTVVVGSFKGSLRALSITFRGLGLTGSF